MSCGLSKHDCIFAHNNINNLSLQLIPQSLNDARAAHTPGNIVCHVPEVQEDTWTYGR